VRLQDPHRGHVQAGRPTSTLGLAATQLDTILRSKFVTPLL
jgi:hypothetical protein